MTRAEGTTRSTIGPRSAITRHVFASHVTRHVLAAAIYAGVTVMFCAGIVVHPLTATLTAMGDGFLTFWDFWWVHKALFDLHANPLRTTWLTYPHEISLVFHVLDLLDGVLTLPLQRFSPGLDGVTLAVNVAICLSFLLSALAAYAAALVVTDSWLPSVVAGLGYGFSAYHVSRADMPVTAALYWLPLFAVLAVRAIRDGGIGRMATVGACVGLCTFQSAYHALLLLLLAPFVALVAVRDGLDRRLVLPRLAAVGFAIGIGASPMLTLVGVELQRDHYTTTGVPMGKPVSADVDCRESIDLLGLIVPGPTQGLWRPVAPAWNRYLARPTCPVPMWGENGYGGAQAYVGLVPLCLAGLAIWRSRRRTLPWALGALFFASLALGPNLHVGGTILRTPWLPLPYRLLLFMPAAARGLFHRPYYLWPGALFMLWMLAAQGLALAHHASTASGRKRLAGAGLLLWLVLDYASPPLRAWHVPHPPAWTLIAADSRPEAVIDLPARSWSDLEYFSFAQVLHGKPIARGFVSRFDDWTAQRDELLRQAEVSPVALRAVLQQTGPAYVVVHRELPGWRPAPLTAIETLLAPLRIYADASMVVYRWPTP